MTITTDKPFSGQHIVTGNGTKYGIYRRRAYINTDNIA